MVGTPSYAAVSLAFEMSGLDCDDGLQPEVLKSEHYGEAADMWGLGCILYEMMSLNFLWESKGLLAIKVCVCVVCLLLSIRCCCWMLLLLLLRICFFVFLFVVFSARSRDVHFCCMLMTDVVSSCYRPVRELDQELISALFFTCMLRFVRHVAGNEHTSIRQRHAYPLPADLPTGC